MIGQIADWASILGLLHAVSESISDLRNNKKVDKFYIETLEETLASLRKEVEAGERKNKVFISNYPTLLKLTERLYAYKDVHHTFHHGWPGNKTRKLGTERLKIHMTSNNWGEAAEAWKESWGAFLRQLKSSLTQAVEKELDSEHRDLISAFEAEANHVLEAINRHSEGAVLSRLDKFIRLGDDIFSEADKAIKDVSEKKLKLLWSLNWLQGEAK